MAEYIKRDAVGKIRRLGSALEKIGNRVSNIAESTARVIEAIKSVVIKVDTESDCIVKISIVIMSGNVDVPILRGESDG